MKITDEERILAVFERKPKDKIPFNIRHEYWYFVNKAKGTLPPNYEKMDLANICESWGASWRCYSGYYVESFVKVNYENVKFITEKYGNKVRTIIETPVGRLESLIIRDQWGLSGQYQEYLIKTIKDLKILEFVLDNVKVSFDYEIYEKLKARVRGRGIVSYFFPRSPLQALFYNYMGIIRTIKFLIRHKREIRDFMEVIREYNGKFYEVIASTPLKILNLGENIDVRITSPRLFEKYCLPYYQEIADYLHKRDKYVHIHVDGFAKPLLPLLKETGLDGIEALTPKPVGDMTLDDIKKVLGDEMIIIDGIPYILFLPNISLSKLEKFIRKIISIFPDNLVLGISDELPPPSDINRVKFVSKIVNEMCKA